MFCRWQYGQYFIDVVASQIFQIQRNSPNIRTYSSSTSSKVNDMQLSTIVIINSNFGSISCTVFEILTHLGSVE